MDDWKKEKQVRMKRASVAYASRKTGAASNQFGNQTGSHSAALPIANHIGDLDKTKQKPDEDEAEKAEDLLPNSTKKSRQKKSESCVII